MEGKRGNSDPAQNMGERVPAQCHAGGLTSRSTGRAISESFMHLSVSAACADRLAQRMRFRLTNWVRARKDDQNVTHFTHYWSFSFGSCQPTAQELDH